ncbi:tRNA (guanosine(37)-N1)-methyltransferase TrmD [Patescibacteria group bacterium]|nr:tRNA (guanosine(37)-N1)-methyltransferase TrmD [Patescibacteria group bacterium]
MRFEIITIFPHIFDSFLKTSIIKRAKDRKLINIKIHDLRKWAVDKHKTIDDKPYGGGPGMVFKVDTIYRTLKSLNKDRRKRQSIVLLTPQGKQFDQKTAKRLSKKDRLILVCGRYEGFDNRIKKFVDEQISIGPYILNGGEVPAMTLIEVITRLLPKVIREESLKEESFSFKSSINLEYPQYTRPEVFTYKDKSGKLKTLKVPKILLSGNHAKIKEWKEKVL